MVYDMATRKMCILILLLLILLCTSQIGSSISGSLNTESNVGSVNDSVFLDSVARDTWNYLHSSQATNEIISLPYSWSSAKYPKGGHHSNPAEIGLYALSWIAAFDLKRPWSPTWTDTERNVTKILDQLMVWQNNNNSYKNKVFYQWYWVDRGEVGNNTGDKVVPSIDNAWLAMSLITIREYSRETNRTDLESKCNALLSKMNFTELWYHPTTHRFTLGDLEDPQAGHEADYFSNENRIINFVSRSLGQLSPEEFNESLKRLDQHVSTPG